MERKSNGMAKDDRTIFDLSDEEYKDYEAHPEKYDDITENSNDDAIRMMFPDPDARKEYIEGW